MDYIKVLLIKLFFNKYLYVILRIVEKSNIENVFVREFFLDIFVLIV